MTKDIIRIPATAIETLSEPDFLQFRIAQIPALQLVLENYGSRIDSAIQKRELDDDESAHDNVDNAARALYWAYVHIQTGHAHANEEGSEKTPQENFAEKQKFLETTLGSHRSHLLIRDLQTLVNTGLQELRGARAL